MRYRKKCSFLCCHLSWLLAKEIWSPAVMLTYLLIPMQPSHCVLLELGWSPRAPPSPDPRATAPSSSLSQLQSDPFCGTEKISPNYSRNKITFLKQASKVLAQNAVLKMLSSITKQKTSSFFQKPTHGLAVCISCLSSICPASPVSATRFCPHAAYSLGYFSDGPVPPAGFLYSHANSWACVILGSAWCIAT